MSFRVRGVGFDGVFVLVTTLTSLLGLVTRSSSSSSSCRGSTAVLLLYTHVIIFTRRFLLKSSNTRSAHTSVTSPSSPHLWPPLRVLARKADFCRCLTANHVDSAKKGTQTSPKSLSLGPPVGFFSRYILVLGTTTSTMTLWALDDKPLLVGKHPHESWHDPLLYAWGCLNELVGLINIFSVTRFLVLWDLELDVSSYSRGWRIVEVSRKFAE